MALQVDLLKKIDEEKEKETAASSAAASSDNENAESTISVNVKSGSSSSASSTGISSFGEEQEVEEVEPIPEPEEEEKEAPLPPIVKPAQKKAEEAASAATKRPQARGLTSVEKILYAKWFDGDTPTEVETVAQIFRLGEVDPERAQQAYDIYNQLKTSGQFKETYGAGNSDWIAKMNELGIEKTENLSQADLDYLYGYVRENGTVTASGSLSNAKKYGAASVAAYNVNEFLKDYEATQGLLAEQNELFKELSYWVANGYTNDEIKGKINLSKYNGLYAAQEKTKNGQYTPTTSAIPALTSYGIDGMLFAIRNPNDSKNDYFLDAVQGQLGRGVQPTSTPEQIARRTAGDPAYAPYAVGTTMHDEAMLFGMTGFDRKWLDENHARIEASGDPKLKQAFARVYDAVDFTEKAEAEAVALKGFIEKRLNAGASPEEIFTDELLENYPSLQKMYEGQKKLNLVDVAHAVDFDLYAWQKEAEKFYGERKGTISGKDYEKTISEGLGSNMPAYEGQDELDKAEEENIKLYRQTMDYTNTTPAEGAALTIKTPDFVRVAASVSTGISAGTGGYDEAYLAAAAVANDYVGKHYLSAVTTKAAKQAELDALTKPVNDFVEKWFPGQDADAVVRKLVDGEMEMQDSAEYQQDLQALYNSTNYLGTYLEDKTRLEAGIANEDTILLRIDEQIKMAEELNVSGKPTQSVMPMVKFMEGFYNYDVKADYAEFGDWQYQVEASGMDWATVSGELGTRKENNLAAIQELDVAIAKAESWGNDPALIDNMRRARDVYELDNKLIEYALLQDTKGFAEAVKQFDEKEESKANWLNPSRENELKNLMVEYTRLTSMDMPKDATMSAEDAFLNYAKVSNLNEDLALKITLMTDNERDTFKYLYESEEYGPKAAEEFFSTLESAHLESRQTAYREMVTEERTEQHPGLMNVLSIAASPIQAIGVVEVVRAALTGDDIDPDSEWFAVSQVVGKVRDVTTEGIVEHFGEGTVAAKVATFGYQVVTSMGDSLAAGATGSGLVTMGLEAFTNTALECAEKGVGTWDTVLMSGVNMLAEMATEKLPFDQMTDAFKNGGKEGLQGLIRSVLAGSASEAPGEALSELISVVGEDKILGEFGRYEQLVDEFYKTTNDRTEAEMMAVKEIVKQIGVAGLAGAFSGGGQTAISYGAGALKNAPKKNAPQPKVVEEQTAPAQQEAPVEEAPTVEQQAPAEEESALAEEQQAPAQQPHAPFEYTKPEVATTGALEKKAPANIRMVTALSDAQMEGVGLDKKTATVQGVFEAGGLNPELALAAAKDLAKNSPVLQKLQQALQKADESGVLDVLKAFAYRALVPSTNVDGMTDSDVISAVENDPAKAQELAGAVMNSEIAEETVNVLSEMDSTAIKGNFKSVRSAKQSVNEAAKRLSLLEADVENSRKALQTASAELKQNPSDSKLVNRALRIAREMKAKQMTAEQARLEVEKARGRYNDAKTTLEEESIKRANEARREAKLRVEQRMAERAAMMQQQKAAEEQQRIADEQKAAQQTAVAEQSTPVAESPAVEKPVAQTSPLDESAPTLTMNPQSPAPAAPATPATAPNIPAPPPGMGVSQFAGPTGQNTNVISDGVKQELHDSPYYKKTTQRENVDRAISAIEKDGYEVRKNKILDGTTDIMTPEGQAELYVLTKVAKDTGDAAGESAIVFKAKESGTTLAQAMAMRKLYIDMSPAGKAQYVERIIDQMNRELEGRGSDRRIAPPEWLAKRLEEANGDDQQTNAVLDDAYRYIAEQTPPSIGDRINTWRYLAMLGNPLTHAKNFLSTLAQTPYVLVKNKTAAVGEIIAQNAAKKKGKDFERTKSLGPIKKEYLAAAKEVYQEYKSTLRGDPETPMQKINDWRSKSWAWMDKLSRYNSKKMSDEDMFFKKRYFQNALASYLQANKIDVANPNPDVMARATQYAYEQAMKNTFNNTNAFAEWLTSSQNDAKRRGGLVKLADPIIGAILPFKKTPANVIMRGIEYSPLGLLNSITTNSIKLKRGKDFNGKPYTINQWIDSVSAGLTGTMAAGLGGLLAAIGVLELGDEEEDDLRGVQKNSINVLGINISIDSFGSAAMPLLIGAEMYEQFMADQPEYLEDGFQLTDTPELFTQFLSALGTVADPVMELSVMQGLNSLLSSASYSDNSLFAIGERVGTSFVSQFVPSFAGAIARLADGTRRTVYIDKNSALDSQMQYFLQSIRNKIPGLSQQGAAYLDVWGNEVSNGDFVTRLLSNFLIPGYPKEQQDPDEVTQRLLQLFDDTGMEGFLPSEANKYFTVDGERYNLSAEEYQKYSKTRGDIAHEALESLLANEEFNTAGDVPMLTAVNRVWSYASQMAAYSVNDGYKVESGVLNADNPVEYALEGMRDKAKAEQQAEYELGLVDAIAAGDIQSATACVAGIKQTGRKNNTIKNKVANAYRMKYKTMYEEGDIDGMADLERDLYSLGIGFSVSDFENWLK